VKKTSVVLTRRATSEHTVGDVFDWAHSRSPSLCQHDNTGGLTGGLAWRWRVSLDQRTRRTSGSVSTGMGDRVWVQCSFPGADIYLGM